jgi:tungstate transport system substrate-binding protein
LQNPYGIIAVNPERYPDVNYAAVQKLIRWFESDEARILIAGYKVDGEQLFYPVMK